MLLNALVNFIDSSSFDTVLPKSLELNLSQTFSAFFSTRVLCDKHYVMDNLGEILLQSSKLGFIKDHQLELQNVILVCLQVFNSKLLSKTEQCLNNCHRIGAAFLIWNYNPGQEFFSSYFKAIEKSYNRYKYKERFCVSVLKNCLLIGLNLCEEEFKNFASFWTREMAEMAQHLKRVEIDELLEICVQKYDGNKTDIENILSKPVLLHLLNNTDSYRARSEHDMICFTDLPLVDQKSNLAMDKKNYLNICNQLVAGDSNSISGRVLSRLPEAAISFHDERKFIESVSIIWWQEFKSKLHDLQGYRLVHPLYALRKINKKFHQKVSNQFRNLHEHPAQKIAMFALKDIENESFTASSFSSLIDSLEELLLKSTMRPISPILIEELSNGFSSFFSSQQFCQRKFADQFHKKVGEIIFRANMLSVSRPNDDNLITIINCCSENFKLRFNNDDGISVNYHLWNLERAAITFVEWNVDADIYYPSFWYLYFKQIENNYSKLKQRSVDSTLKILLLTNVLIIVLKFDKENDFEQLKHLWQEETQLHVNSFRNEEIEKFFILSKQRGKFNRLVEIISEPVYKEFRRRVALK